MAVITGSIGDWDLRRASVTGRIQRVLRYLDKAMDDATVKIREMQKDGKNVSRFLFFMTFRKNARTSERNSLG